MVPVPRRKGRPTEVRHEERLREYDYTAVEFILEMVIPGEHERSPIGLEGANSGVRRTVGAA
jgi:hypothetical protein